MFATPPRILCSILLVTRRKTSSMISRCVDSSDTKCALRSPVSKMKSRGGGEESVEEDDEEKKPAWEVSGAALIAPNYCARFARASTSLRILRSSSTKTAILRSLASSSRLARPER